MQSLASLADMRTEILAAARVDSGDTAFISLVDSWINRKAARVAHAFDFPELMSRWSIDLGTTAPTPDTWAPFELTTVPRDMLKLIEAHILDTTNSSDQPKHPLKVLPNMEFHRMVGLVNPPPSGRPSAVTIRRREGSRGHEINKASGTAGIRVTSTVTETYVDSTSLLVGATYYADANRTTIRKVQSAATLTAGTALSLTTDTHYGIISLSVNEAPLGRLTFDNTAGSIAFGELLPWERNMGFTVLAFNRLPDLTTYEFHCTYKRTPQYMSQASDTLQPLPALAQDLIIAWARMKALKHQEDPDWKAEMADVQIAELELLHAYRFTEDEEPHMVLDDLD